MLSLSSMHRIGLALSLSAQDKTPRLQKAPHSARWINGSSVSQSLRIAFLPPQSAPNSKIRPQHHLGNRFLTLRGVTLTPSSAQAIDFRQSISLSASIANDTSNKGVAWALNGAGSLSEETPTSVIYNAPASGNAGTATVTATSAADSTKSASVT